MAELLMVLRALDSINAIAGVNVALAHVLFVDLALALLAHQTRPLLY